MSFDMSNADCKTKRKRIYKKRLPEMSLDDWVAERKNKDCVKFYKSRASLSSQYPQLRCDGFFVLMMTKPQMDLMKRLCEKVVCIDRHKGETFEVITLNIIDDLGHSFPCASVFTDRIDQSVVEAFFSEIKAVIGSVSVKLLMSGKDEFISDTWSRVIGQPGKKVCSSWEILKEWKTNLYLIQNKKKRTDVFKKLKTLLNEPVKEICIQTVNNLVSELSIDIETSQFGLYMVGNYFENPSSWAPCFVFEESFKFNHQLEMMHLTLKHIFQDKTTKRFDKALSNVLELLRSKVYDRLVILSGDKSRTFNLIKKHNLSQKCTFKVIKKNSYWSVLNLTGKKEKHKVRFGNRECKCSQKCRYCDVCYHVYTCSCPESNVRLNMCRHIHGLCVHQAAGTVEHASDSDASDSEAIDLEQTRRWMEEETFFNIGQEVDVVCQNLYTDDTLLQFDTVYVDETEAIVDQYSPEQSTPGGINLESRKDRLESLFHTMLDNASNERQLEEIENTLYILQGKLRGVKSRRKSTKRPSEKVQFSHNIKQEFVQESCRNIKKPRN